MFCNNKLLYHHRVIKHTDDDDDDEYLSINKRLDEPHRQLMLTQLVSGSANHFYCSIKIFEIGYTLEYF